MDNGKLPKILEERLEHILGRDFLSVIHAFSSERNGSFRINTLKSTKEEIQREFREKGIVVTAFEKIRDIYTFARDQEYAIKGTDAFYQGKIYLQSLSSLLPALVLDPQSGDTILDVCAAPGSKTTQIAMMMRNEGHIIALEQNQIRYDKLMYNARLQGASIIEGVKVDARVFLVRHCEERSNPGTGDSGSPRSARDDRHFDRILLDAPCSAEGRISIANEKSYGFWSLENIAKKAESQYELLSLALSLLKKGGTLVYSTCTLAPEENEGVIARILSENSDLMLEPIDIGLSGETWWRPGLTAFASNEYGEHMKKAVRILPSDETEGFFMVKIVRN